MVLFIHYVQLLKSAVEILCSIVEVICLDQLLILFTEINCCDYLLRSAVEMICVLQLFSRSWATEPVARLDLGEGGGQRDRRGQ